MVLRNWKALRPGILISEYNYFKPVSSLPNQTIKLKNDLTVKKVTGSHKMFCVFFENRFWGSSQVSTNI